MNFFNLKCPETIKRLFENTYEIEIKKLKNEVSQLAKINVRQHKRILLLQNVLTRRTAQARLDSRFKKIVKEKNLPLYKEIAKNLEQEDKPIDDEKIDKLRFIISGNDNSSYVKIYLRKLAKIEYERLLAKRARANQRDLQDKSNA